MLVLDGNNSLKRMATRSGRTAGDTRLFDSDYFLPREFVDEFSNEVKSRQVQAKPGAPDSDEEEQEAPADHGTYPTDGSASSERAPCALHWRAAASDESKRMWGAFDETGIFACACRHAMILWVVDMVRSGEL